MSVDRTDHGWVNSSDSAELTACGETMAVVRKKTLLRILACHDAERTGISVTEADVRATSDWFRRSFGLLADEEFSSWTDRHNLTEAAFARAMHDFFVVRRLEEVYAREINELVSDQIAISTARLRCSSE
jgi:hypothetical protein